MQRNRSLQRHQYQKQIMHLKKGHMKHIKGRTLHSKVYNPWHGSSRLKARISTGYNNKNVSHQWGRCNWQGMYLGSPMRSIYSQPQLEWQTGQFSFLNIPHSGHGYFLYCLNTILCIVINFFKTRALKGQGHSRMEGGPNLWKAMHQMTSAVDAGAKDIKF